MSNWLGNCLPVALLLAGIYLVVEDAHAKGARSSSSSRSSSSPSSSSTSTPKKVQDDDGPASRNVNVRVRSSGSDTSSAGYPGQGVTSLQSTGTAAAIGTTAGATAGSAALQKQGETPDEARERIAKRNAQLLAEQEARERAALEQREANQKLVEKAQRDRERLAAEEEQRRAARRQSAHSIVQVQRSACEIKPVMTQAQIDACR